jgi:hypothetical protein
MGNSKTQLILCGLVVIWSAYSLVAPGEAMSKPVVIMNYFALFGAVMGAIGAGMQMAKGK